MLADSVGAGSGRRGFGEAGTQTTALPLPASLRTVPIAAPAGQARGRLTAPSQQTRGHDSASGAVALCLAGAQGWVTGPEGRGGPAVLGPVHCPPARETELANTHCFPG